MSAKYMFVFLAAAACLDLTISRPVRRTLNFNMFVLKPDAQDRLLLSTDGVSRFGPLLEYLVQRFQGMMSVRVHPDESAAAAAPVPLFGNQILPVDTRENEVDSAGMKEANIPGVVLRPSSTKPGTFEVEIAVVVDDGQPTDDKNNKTR